MIKLINETSDMHKPYTGIARIEIVLEDETNLDEMFEGFERFLSASGFHIPNGMRVGFEEQD